jgi:hypothetical protein
LDYWFLQVSDNWLQWNWITALTGIGCVIYTSGV